LALFVLLAVSAPVSELRFTLAVVTALRAILSVVTAPFLSLFPTEFACSLTRRIPSRRAR
jgi:hypothetical protein